MTRPQRGFTLIELLVVVAIGAILTSMAALSLNFGGRDEQLSDEAKRIAALLRLAADDAVLSRRELGLRLTEAGYAFYRLDRSGEEPRWTMLDQDKRLRERNWPKGVQVELYIEDVPVVLDNPEKQAQKADPDAEPPKPQIMTLSNGETLPYFAIVLRDTEADKAWRVQTGDDTMLTLEPYAY
jgi:general secretion pathway protein H